MTQVNGTVADQSTSGQADQAKRQAHEMKDSASEHVGAVAEEAKAHAGDVVHQVRRDLEARGDEQARKLAGALRDTGSQLHSMADAGGQGFVVDMARGLADGSQRLAGRLDGGGLQAVGDDIRRFARRSPGLFLAGAAMAGFVVSRLVRNSDRSALTGGGSSGSASSGDASSGSASSGSASSGDDRPPVTHLGPDIAATPEVPGPGYDPVGAPMGGGTGTSSGTIPDAESGDE